MIAAELPNLSVADASARINDFLALFGGKLLEALLNGAMRARGLSINPAHLKRGIAPLMKTLMRLGTIALFVAILGFCVFGFVATFEPMPRSDRVIWRTVYALVSAALTLGLFRLLRCQFIRALRRQ